MKKHSAPLLPLLISCLVLHPISFQSRACTLWGAAGDDVGGGTIISKNRDWKPDHHQVLKIRHTGKYAYLGLYAEGNEAPGLKQGVNEKGLCVVSASASSIPKKVREAQPGKGSLMGALLSDYASCDEILADKAKLFSDRKPSFLMIADHNQILMLEEGLHGHYAVKTVKKGIVTHSNHYLESSLSECNETFSSSSSSSVRLKRINELLDAAPRPLEITAFATMSRDRHDGVNNSIWRTGTNGATLSSWILKNPANGAPTLRLLIADPGQPENLETLVLDDKFWKQPPATVSAAK